jgi:hypothetical protein
MRLTPDQIKQGIKHSARSVRNASIAYFADSFNTDPDIMPLIIQAVEEHGWDDAFDFCYLIQRLPQTEATVLWLIEQLEQRGPSQNDENDFLTSWLLEVLANAAPPLLQAQEQRILELGVVDEDMRKAIRDRIALHGLDPETLWRELEELCDHNKSKDYLPDEDIDHAHRLVEAMGRHPNVFDARVIERLGQDIDDYSDNPMIWMEPFLVQLTGELRLEQAVPLVLKRAQEDEVVASREAMWSLARIGTDAVVDALTDVSQKGDWDFRYHTAEILGIVHTDRALERCLGLLQEEKEVDIQCRLAQSALMHFSDEAIQPVRRFAVNDNLDPDDTIEVRSVFIGVTTLMGIDFPERGQWQEDADQYAEFQQGWYTKQNADEEAADPAEDDFANLLPPSATVIHEGPKTGRNDPCPCGSGKRYKQCCLKRRNGKGK